ncbi:MAG: polymer-forming cytoskeletal protein [Candidatus Rokubacteria bacterium]|nr:polymer-forming cytoskeletal protein [Candidatus Rokubacteria bacterium]
MLGKRAPSPQAQDNGRNGGVPITLLTIAGDQAKVEGKFEIADSIQIECEVGGELNVGGRFVIGEKGVVNANVKTVDAVIMGHYEGNMIATGNVEIADTGRVSGNIQTDSLVISKGGFFNGNVTKINEETRGQRPVYLIEEKRAGQR